MITSNDVEVLEKFKKGKNISNDEKNIIEQFRKIGFVKMGINIKNDKIEETAILTPLGKRILKKAKILNRINKIKNPKIRNFLA